MKKLQRIRRATGKVKIAENPAAILPKLPLYWRAVYAVCKEGSK